MAHKKRGKAVPNRDPITKETGSHPLGTGIGAAAGALGGAVVGGAVGGPVGATIGGAAGAVGGGLTGHETSEGVNPTIEDKYWREQFASRPYVRDDAKYDEYQPAYRYGWEAAVRYRDRRFDDVEPDLARDWESVRGNSRLEWNVARNAARDAWEHVERAQRDREDD
jgi:hypothetical protein